MVKGCAQPRLGAGWPPGLRATGVGSVAASRAVRGRGGASEHGALPHFRRSHPRLLPPGGGRVDARQGTHGGTDRGARGPHRPAGRLGGREIGRNGVCERTRKMILRRNRSGFCCTRGQLVTLYDTLEILELPWLDNHVNVSCIPAGTYSLDLYSPFKESLGVGGHCLKLSGVEDRTDILIHVANWVHQLRGCIAVGLSGNATSVSSSRAALRQLIGAWRSGDRVLTIRSAEGR